MCFHLWCPNDPHGQGIDDDDDDDDDDDHGNLISSESHGMIPCMNEKFLSFDNRGELTFT